MDADGLRAALPDALGPLARDLGLGPDPLTARYVPNVGGFVSANFTVSDGSRAVHAKCVRDESMLAPWRDFGALLAERYRAPRVLGWLEIEEWTVMICEHVGGRAPTEEEIAPLAHEILGDVLALHADAELAARLPPAPLRTSFADYFVGICASDLDELEEGGFPPFVDDELRTYMRAQVDALREHIASSPAFDGDAHAAIHGDLWPGNVLIGDGAPRIVDWDELRRGDPALDLSLLLFTPIERGDLDARALLGARDPAFWERFDLGYRATLLSAVVDSLADWMEAEHAPPEIVERARAHREGMHRWALERYRALDPPVRPAR